MSSDVSISISIPADADGYVLLQCEHCGTFFKILADSFRDDSILDIYCPCCGLISDDYFTDDVMELATAVAQNYMMGIIYEEFKKMERSSKNSFVRIKAGKKPTLKSENPVRIGIDNLRISRFSCCNRSVKVKPLLRMTGCYCAYCGVKEYDVN